MSTVDDLAKELIRKNAAASGAKGCYGAGKPFNYYEVFPEHSQVYPLFQSYLCGVERGALR